MRRKILALSIAVLLMFSLSGCAPKGYLRNKNGGRDPLIYNGDIENAIQSIAQQFPEINSTAQGFYDIHNSTEDGKMYFMFDGLLYHRESTFWEFTRVSESAVYRDDVLIGQLYKLPKDWQTTSEKYVNSYISFIHDNYLDYSIVWHKSVFTLNSHSFSEEYIRYEFYRFNLNTAENKEIKLTQFIEALQNIDNRWEINPEYKGER